MRAVVFQQKRREPVDKSLLEALRRIVGDYQNIDRIERLEDLSPTEEEPVVLVFRESDPEGALAETVLRHVAENNSPGEVLVVCVSGQIDARALRRLLRVRPFEWLPEENAVDEIGETLSRWQIRRSPTGESQNARLIAFQPSSGGVGNTTLTLETAIAVAGDRSVGGRPIAVLELDFSNGSLAEYSNQEPRFDVSELEVDAKGLDTQLVTGLSGPYSENLDIFAPPRQTRVAGSDNLRRVLGVLNAINERYGHVFVDLPNEWTPLTSKIALGADTIFITTTLSLASMFRASERRRALMELGVPSDHITVIVNRYYKRLSGGHLKLADAKKILDTDRILTVSIDDPYVVECQNTGRPVISTKRRRFSKEIGAISRRVIRGD